MRPWRKRAAISGGRQARPRLIHLDVEPIPSGIICADAGVLQAILVDGRVDAEYAETEHVGAVGNAFESEIRIRA